MQLIEMNCFRSKAWRSFLLSLIVKVAFEDDPIIVIYHRLHNYGKIGWRKAIKTLSPDGNVQREEKLPKEFITSAEQPFNRDLFINSRNNWGFPNIPQRLIRWQQEIFERISLLQLATLSVRCCCCFYCCRQWHSVRRSNYYVELSKSSRSFMALINSLAIGESAKHRCLWRRRRVSSFPLFATCNAVSAFNRSPTDETVCKFTAVAFYFIYRSTSTPLLPRVLCNYI